MNKNLSNLAKEHCDFRVSYVCSKEPPIIESSDFLSIYDRKTMVKMSIEESEWERAYQEKL